MKNIALVLILFVIDATVGLARPNEMKLAIAQTGSPRSFVAGDEHSKIMVLLSNLSDKPQRVWQTSNSWGARTVTLEVTDLQGAKLGEILNGQQGWMMNWYTFDTIAPGDFQVFPISVHAPWVLQGEALKDLPKDVWHKVRIRAIFTSRDYKKQGVWTGHLESPFYDFEFRIKSGQQLGGVPHEGKPIQGDFPKLNVPDLNVPNLAKFPDGDYSVNLEWWKRKENLVVRVRNNEAEVIQSSDPLLADMKAMFQAGDDGTFNISFQAKDNQGGSQKWVPQHDGTFIIKEAPDRGEKERAVPMQKNL